MAQVAKTKVEGRRWRDRGKGDRKGKEFDSELDFAFLSLCWSDELPSSFLFPSYDDVRVQGSMRVTISIYSSNQTSTKCERCVVVGVVRPRQTRFSFSSPSLSSQKQDRPSLPLHLRIRLGLAPNLLLEQRLPTLLGLLQSPLVLLSQRLLHSSDQVRVVSGSFPVAFQVCWWGVSFLEGIVGFVVVVVVDVVACARRKWKGREWEKVGQLELSSELKLTLSLSSSPSS